MSKDNRKNKAIETDVVIAGGGMVGMTLAIGLAKLNYSVVIVDMLPEEQMLAEAFDGRASAIAFAGYKMLSALGVWAELKDVAQPILDIRVTDGHAPYFLHFNHEDLGEGPLGYLVENRHTRWALSQAAKKYDNLMLIAPDKIVASDCNDDQACIMLESGKKIVARVATGADGRHSFLRRNAEIPITAFSYDQVGIVATIEHELPHNGVAFERFYPEGPFAILPLTGNRSSLVWSTDAALKDTIMALDDDAMAAEIQKRVGGFLGELSVACGRWSYPLSMQYAHDYVANRLMLVGDSVHAMHPIAGQGLNLGLRDVAAAVEVFSEAQKAGQDIGSLEILMKYQKWRRVDTVSLMTTMDGLTRLFSNKIRPLATARRIGLGIVDRIHPLKRFFMQHARGTVGKLPKLLQGEFPN